jgi:hypothetical protein
VLHIYIYDISNLRVKIICVTKLVDVDEDVIVETCSSSRRFTARYTVGACVGFVNETRVVIARHEQREDSLRMAQTCRKM